MKTSVFVTWRWSKHFSLTLAANFSNGCLGHSSSEGLERFDETVNLVVVVLRLGLKKASLGVQEDISDFYTAGIPDTPHSVHTCSEAKHYIYSDIYTE